MREKLWSELLQLIGARLSILIRKDAKENDRMTYRYLYKLRPPGPGCQPRGCLAIVDYQGKKSGYWGHVDYEKPLSDLEEWDLVLAEK